MGIRDPNPKRAVTVESVPSGADDVTTASSVIALSSVGVFAITNIPDSDALNLWNFLWTINIDVDSDDHRWPDGAALDTFTLEHVNISSRVDWASSSDLSNIRRELISVINSDPTSPHTAYLKYKAYTFVGVAG